MYDLPENRAKTRLSCIFIASQLFEVKPLSPYHLIGTRNKNQIAALSKMVEKITTETFASDVSAPTQLEFINMILGANSYYQVTHFERLS